MSLTANIIDSSKAIESLQRLIDDFTKMECQLIEKENELVKKTAELENLSIAARESDNSIMVFDARGIIVWVNEAFEEMTGFKSSEVVGTDGAPLRGDVEIPIEDTPIYKVLLTKESYSFEVPTSIKEGHDGWLYITYTPVLDDDDNILKVVSISSDITQQKAVEKELKLAKEKAEESEKFKQQFLANMSHEIRTPMNAILGMTNLLQKGSVQESQSRYLNPIQKSAENLLVIINDILDLSKIQAGKIEFEQIHFNLKETIDTVYQTLKFKAEEKNLDLKVSISDSIPSYLVGDPVRLNQILINLAGNGIKFTEQGDVVISVTHTAEKDQKNVLQFAIKDSGIGIPADRLDAIFESFSQAGSDTTRKFGGTGLGLTISKQFAELQGGRIWVESTVGEGSTFFVEIPYPTGNVHDAIAKADEVAPEEVGAVKIILAEDNAFNQIVAEDTIMMWNPAASISIAENGQEVLDLLAKEPYDLILMDVNMPIMNGLEATRAIRKHSNKRIKNTKIMAMTAALMKDEVKEILDAGMNDFVGKPFDEQDLFRKILKLTK